jgi:small-conductance mechanosensitive channel
MRKNTIAAVAVCVGLFPVLLAAQPKPEVGEVRTNGQTLFVIQMGVGSFTPQERAQAASRRLQEVLNSPFARTDLTIRPTDVGNLILVGNTPVISVTESDAKADNVTIQTLSERWAAAIQAGLLRAVGERVHKTWWIRLIVTLAVLATALLALVFVHKGRIRLQRIIEARSERIRPVRFRGLELLSSRTLLRGFLQLVTLIGYITMACVVLVALLLVFERFPETQRYARQVFLWIWQPFTHILRGVGGYLPNLFYILVIIVVTRFVIRALTFIFEKTEQGVISLEPWLHRDVARPTSQIFKAMLIVVALFFIAPLIPGTGSTAAKGISVILGLMVSLGSASTVGNLIAGVVLTYMRPFRIGERVQIGDKVGDVSERTFLYTKLLTIKNEEVIVPSLHALSGAIVNYSAKAESMGLILHTTVTIGYDTPWRKVHELLIRAADKTADILKDPRPFVLQTSLDDFFVSYQINAVTDQPNQMARIYSELHQNIQDAFNEEGIEIMSAHYFQVRDGNTTTVPASHRPPRYEPPRFLLEAKRAEARR